MKMATTESNLAYGAQGDMENSTKHLPSEGPRQHDVELSRGITTSSEDPDELYDTIDGEELRQVLQLTENQAYAATTNIPVLSNQCYSATTPSAQGPDEIYATIDGEEQQQDLQLTWNQAYTAATNIPVVSGQCYSTTTPSAQDADKLYDEIDDSERVKQRKRQLQDMELVVNQSTPNIMVEPNQCYVTTNPSVLNPDQLQIELTDNHAYEAIPTEYNMHHQQISTAQSSKTQAYVTNIK
jgi:hypothetical protein